MSRLSSSDRLAAVHADAMREFDAIQRAVRDERMQCLKDRRFCMIAGAQWEGSIGEQFANKPRFEFNKSQLAVYRVINEYRNNRITVDFQSKDGSDDDDLADTCDGLYRSDEKYSTADEAYDNAFDEGVQGGMGAWRLRACYQNEDDDDDDRQRVAFEPITDADSTVFFDLNAKRQDKSDAKRCYVMSSYTYDAYREEWGEDPSGMQKQVNQNYYDWITPDIVWVCELYKTEEKTELAHFFRGLDEKADDMKVMQSELDADPEKLNELTATGFREVRQKRLTRKVVHKYILSGAGVLEDCGIIPGRFIPVVPFYAKRGVIDGIERLMGHVRLAADAQRLTNMLLSWLAEMAGRFDIEKPILSPAQVAGHAQMWASDNVEKFAYLLLNPDIDANGSPVPGSQAPIAYTKAPNIPPAMAALAQIAMQSLDDMLGAQQAGEQLQPNLSGKAVELIQNRLDMQVFIYMSNLAKSMKRSGEIWLSMMKDIIVEQSRPMKTIDAGGQSSSVMMNDPSYDQDTGEDYLANDLTQADFEVDVDVGPSSSSKRAATVRALTGLAGMTQDPEIQAALTIGSIANIEGEGLQDLHAWARKKGIQGGFIKPTPEEEQEQQQAAANQQPDPQQTLLAAAADQAQADAGQSRAKTVDVIADAELKRAQTAKTMADTMGAHQQQQIASAQALQAIMYPPSQQQPS